MPAAKNTTEVMRMLEKELRKAMQVVQSKAHADMYEETGDYYTGGKPRMYMRTGALGDTPQVTALSQSQNGFEFTAYLDESHQYTTGDNPTMTQVLNLANYGSPWITSGGRPAHDTIGKKGFWERAQQKMEESLNKTIGDFFN